MSLSSSTWPGVMIGLAVAGAVMFAVERGRRPPPRWPDAGPVLSDCDGQIRELVIQYVAGSAEISAPAYRSFLPLLPDGITVRVLCSAQSDFDDLARRVGPVNCKLAPVVTGHAMTCWARDRWLALKPPKSGGPVTLLCPAFEDAQEAWPARAGDARIAADLACALPKRIKSFRSRLLFDGGDFVCDSETAFVNPAVIRRNIPSVVQDERELCEELAQLLKRRIVLLRDAPEHHTEMFMTLLPGKLALVGDPSWGCRVAGLDKAALALLSDGGGVDSSPETQGKFESVAETCRAAGYRVASMPLLPGRDSRTWLSCLNVVVDQREGWPVVYMPVYCGADALNDAAEKAWRDCGASVRRVDCTSTYTSFGSLHCLVGITGRE